jgi:hypothetical protein
VLLEPLFFRTVPVTVAWQQPPAAITQSQALLRPAPAVQLITPTPSNELPSAMLGVALSCLLSAQLMAQVDANGMLQTASNDAAQASIVVPQTLQGSWNSILVFDAVSVAGRRLSRYNVTAACALGQQRLPELFHTLAIAGCSVGHEPGGSTGWLCNECPPGTYSDGGAMACRQCPLTGAACTGGELRLLPGFFLASSLAQAFMLDSSSELLPCFNPEACTLNATSRIYGCSDGYSGPLCGVCQSGYTLFGQVCARCWPAWASGLLLGGIVTALLAAVAWLALFHKPGARSPASIALRQLIGLLQMLSVVTSFRQQTAGLARSVLGWTDVANASLLSFGPLGCQLSLPFLGRFALTLVLPVAFALLVSGAAWVQQLSKQHCRRHSVNVLPSATETVMLTRASTITSAGTRLATSKQAAPAGRLTERMVSVALLLISLLYMPLLSACLRALDCSEQPIAGVTYLREDMRVACGAGEHSIARVLAWAVLAALGLGFPAFILSRLTRCCRCSCPRNHGIAGRLSRLPAANCASSVWRPLYDGYDVQRGILWWEAVVLLRKALLALVGTLLGSSAQGIPALAAVLLASLALQEAVQPYEEPRFNWGERVSLSGAFAAAVLATLYQSEGFEGSASNLAVTGAITAIAFAALLVLVLQWAHAIRADVSAASLAGLLRRPPCVGCRASSLARSLSGKPVAHENIRWRPAAHTEPTSWQPRH